MTTSASARNATACVLLRHAVRPRWIGDLHATFCDECGCIYIPEPAPAIRVVSPLGPDRSSGPTDPAPVAPLPIAAVA